MHTINICFTSLYGYTVFNPSVAGRVGGAEVQLYYMANALARDSRFSVHFLTGDFGQPSSEARGRVQVRSFFNPAGRYKYARSIMGAYRLLRLLMDINPHICIVRAPGFEAGITGIFCILFHKKLLYMVSQHLEPERKKNYGMHIVRWILFKFLLRSADLVLSQHEDQQKQLYDYFGRQSVIRRNAYPLSTDNQHSESSVQNPVLWVGRCDLWKQPELFIRLARFFPQTPLVMICPPSGDDAYFNRIKKEASAIHNLQFLPQVSFADIGSYFSRAAVFVNTSVSEGFPNTFLQALDARTAVASLTADPGRAIETYQFGYCAHGNFEQLKNNVRKLLDNKDDRARRGENGYRYLAEHHDLERISIFDKKLVIVLCAKEKGKPMIMEFVQYGAGGAVAAAVNFTSLFLLTEKVGLHYLTSAVMSYPFAFLVGFLFQALITFKRTERLLQKMVWFFFHQSLGFGLFIVLMYVITDILGFYYVVSFVISAGVVYIFNFTFSKVLVFRSRH